MRKLKYQLCTPVNRGSEASPLWTDKLAAVEMEYSEINLAIAREEAYEGRYEIVDDAQEEVPNIR